MTWRSLLCGSAVLMMVGVAAYAGGPIPLNPIPPLFAKVVRPLEVDANMTGNDPVGHIWSVVGHYQYGPVTKADDIWNIAEGRGGGCIFYQSSPHVCGTDDDCADVKPTNGEAYCLDPKFDSRRLRYYGQCWLRGQQDASCNLAKPPAPALVEGQKYDVPSTGKMSFHSPIKLRVVTCLNPVNTFPPPCGSDSRKDAIARGAVYWPGPVKTLQ